MDTAAVSRRLVLRTRDRRRWLASVTDQWGCMAPAEIKIADSWGDSARGCTAHVEEALLNVRSVFIASEELGGLAAYLNR
ncbi:hypothetical protein FBZ33_3670 [Micromonospora sp. A202]|nr:hypothetical protein FBZ33_3670 [Micromonospora sp. A202]